MQAPKKNIPDLEKQPSCGTGPTKAPNPEMPKMPDANVAATTDHCIVPPHAEATRLDTGAPCGDGRDAE